MHHYFKDSLFKEIIGLSNAGEFLWDYYYQYYGYQTNYTYTFPINTADWGH